MTPANFPAEKMPTPLLTGGERLAHLENHVSAGADDLERGLDTGGGAGALEQPCLQLAYPLLRSSCLAGAPADSAQVPRSNKEPPS